MHNPQSHEGTFRTPALYLAGLEVKKPSTVVYTVHNDSRSPVMVLFLVSRGNFQNFTFNYLFLYLQLSVSKYLTHCGRVTQICVFNTVKLGTSASSP